MSRRAWRLICGAGFLFCLFLVSTVLAPVVDMWDIVEGVARPGSMDEGNVFAPDFTHGLLVDWYLAQVGTLTLFWATVWWVGLPWCRHKVT